MARLIDDDALVLENAILMEDEYGLPFKCIPVEDTRFTPFVDAVPVAHGRWKQADDGDGAVCSVCGEDFCNVYLEVERFNYCPNCGAHMDLEVE